MQNKRELRNRLIRIGLLLIIGWSIVVIIRIFFSDMIGNNPSSSSWLSFTPTYNTDGSWFHSVTGIGYHRELLILENVIVLLIMIFILRIIDYVSHFFHIERVWLILCDFGLAATISRTVARITDQFTLDYLGIGGSIYDFFDIFIGISIVALVMWLVRYHIKFQPYKKAKTKGMAFWKRFCWECQFEIILTKTIFSPKIKWKYDFDYDQSLQKEEV